MQARHDGGVSLRVLIGERVTLRFQVDNIEGKDFTISNAQYTVKIGDVIENSGTMTIDGHELSFLFNPTKAGYYSIEIMYDIGTDRRRSRFPIEVVE